MTVLFQGSFGMDRTRMAGLRAAALKNPQMKDKDLPQPFGYGSPFAAKYRSWLHNCGLAERVFPIKLTALGRVVVDND